MDFEEMGARLGLEKEEFMELVDIFVSSAEEDIQKLNNALSVSDSKAVAEAAHSLKGSSGNLGFSAIADLASRIEQNARKSDLTDLDSYSVNISCEIEKIKVVIS
ncbi:Hpt domain-containing protein [Desulforegula conservatrix]|uniref:Hpt domain-containing protein n=1 Tax=Desulforegula conservatrix TaxID=153026 RepID=UPI000413AFC9|nr:Hpt domain-containing protein [Desulforegula conservatrix]